MQPPTVRNDASPNRSRAVRLLMSMALVYEGQARKQAVVMTCTLSI
jgi:hypothetical protein